MAGGVPVRSLLALLLFVLLWAARPKLVGRGVWAVREPLLVIAYAAFVGAAVSVLNHVPLSVTARQLMEIHGQAALGVLTGHALLEVLGARRLVLAFSAVVGVSSAVALMQAGGLDPAWRLRDALQHLQTYDLENVFLAGRLRAMGLSFSPVHLGTQLCLAFAAFYCLRLTRDGAERAGKLSRPVAGAVAAAVLVAIVSGNRSPILGFAAFVATAVVYGRPARSALLTVFLLPALALAYWYADFVMDLLANSGMRAFRVGDKSSEGREVLRAFGLMLFTNQPFGYGLAFSSTDHVKDYWSELAGFANAETVWGNAIHNYYLNILHKYGALILPLAAYVALALWRHTPLLLAILPYAVHIYFHNDGPLQSDFLIWYFVPLAIILAPGLGGKDRRGGRRGPTGPP
jgi:hypothetical protein